MGVTVHERLMNMSMRVRLAPIPILVRVLMVLVVHVRMRVLDEFMDVLVLVALGEVQPDAERHEQAGRQQLPRHGVALEQHRDQSAEERRDRKIGAGARTAEMSQGEDEEHKACAIAHEADDTGKGNHVDSRQPLSQQQREDDIDDPARFLSARR